MVNKVKVELKNIENTLLIPLWSRAKTFDNAIKDFISKYPNSAIVNLGAGLDTTLFRVDNGKINWYNIQMTLKDFFHISNFYHLRFKN